jgi:hypothetical protein
VCATVFSIDYWNIENVFIVENIFIVQKGNSSSRQQQLKK